MQLYDCGATYEFNRFYCKNWGYKNPSLRFHFNLYSWNQHQKLCMSTQKIFSRISSYLLCTLCTFSLQILVYLYTGCFKSVIDTLTDYYDKNSMCTKKNQGRFIFRIAGHFISKQKIRKNNINFITGIS